MDKIAVLIPCYNESQTVRKVVLDWKQALPEAVIYVYDNNSSDGTADIAKEAGAVVRYEHMQGKGNVIRSLRFPTLIVCGFVVIASFLSFTAGLILQTLIHKDKQAFEFRLQMTEDMYKRKLSKGK